MLGGLYSSGHHKDIDKFRGGWQMVKIIQETEDMYYEDRLKEHMFSLEKKTEGKHDTSI